MTKLEDLTLEILGQGEKFGENFREISNAVGLTENMLKTHIRDIKKILRNHKYCRSNIKGIASDLNISETLSELLLDNYTPESFMNIGERIPKKEKYGLIDLAIECGAETIAEISELTDLNYSATRVLVKKNDKYNGKIKTRGESTISKIKNLVAAGVTDVNEIAKKISRTPDHVYHLSLREGIHITSAPKTKVKKSNPQWDELIKEGYALQEIGDEVGKTRERIRQYIQGTNQYEVWVNAKKSKKIVNRNNTQAISSKYGRNILSDIISQTIENRVMNIPGNVLPKEFADKYLGKYILKKRNHSIKNIFRKRSVLDIYNLFRIYKEAKDDDKKISLAGFEEKTGIWFTNVGRILKSVGLEAMGKSFPRNKNKN